jgi:hypothetical protein
VQHLLLDLPCNTSLHPSSLLATATPYCTQDQLIYSSHLVFFSFAPLVVISANGVVFFLVVLIEIFYLLLVVSNSIVCY